MNILDPVRESFIRPRSVLIKYKHSYIIWSSVGDWIR